MLGWSESVTDEERYALDGCDAPLRRLQHLDDGGSRRESPQWNGGPQVRMKMISGGVAGRESRPGDQRPARGFFVVVSAGAVPITMRPAVSRLGTECGEPAQGEEQSRKCWHAQTGHAS